MAQKKTSKKSPKSKPAKKKPAKKKGGGLIDRAKTTIRKVERKIRGR
jgi:hypothetical protein